MIRHCHHYLLAVLILSVLCHGSRGDDEGSPSLVAPNGIVRLSDGTVLISDIEAHRIWQLHTSGRLSGWGGTGRANYSGDGGPVAQATFNAPTDLKLDVAHNAVLIADANNHRVRRVDLNTHMITTLAGSGTAKLSGDGGPAERGCLDNPQGLAVDRLGNVLVADTYNHVVRRIGTDGILTTVAGSTAGFSGDGGPATSAQLSLPMAVAFDNDERGYFISDFGNSRIRHVSPDGKIETVAGIGKGSDDAGAGFSGDGELATKAKIFSPFDIVVASPNSFYLSDSGNHRVRAVLHGIIVTVAGTGHPSVSGSAKAPNTLSVPAKMALAPDGGLYFCDRGNRLIRLLTKDGKLETIPLRVMK